MSTYRQENVNQRPPQLVDAGFFADIRFDPNDGKPTYTGLNVDNGASTTSDNWKVYKFSYNGTSSNVTRIQLAYGAWDDRASLF